jgi:hypothetical protein
MKKHLLLVGNSIFMAGLADSLAGRFEISRQTLKVSETFRVSENARSQ